MFGKMEQDGLTRFWKIDKDYCLARWSKMVLQDFARLTKVIYLPRLSKIDQDELSSNIKQDLPRIFFGIF